MDSVTAWRLIEEGAGEMDDVEGRTGQRAAYLIVLRHVLVAQDLALTINEFDPEAPVVVVSAPGEAEERLAGVDRLAMAFVGQGPDAYRDSSLSRAVAARGGRVVLMGEEAEAQGTAQGFAVLVRPFTTANILGHLAGG